MDYVPVASPQTESELAVMLSMLEANGIRHFVHNQGFGGLYPGLQIGLYNDRRIMVRADQAPHARQLLSVFDPAPSAAAEAPLTFADKARVLFETLVFGWSFPRSRKRAEPDE
jgi:hypothetical protein